MQRGLPMLNSNINKEEVAAAPFAGEGDDIPVGLNEPKITASIDLGDSDDPAPRVAFLTLGCKVNQSESQKLGRDLAHLGCRIVSPQQRADIFVVNTCSVTHVADKKSRGVIRRVQRENPGARIVVTGCYAASAEEEVRGLGVDLVAGRGQKELIPELIKDWLPVRPENAPVHMDYVSLLNESRTRAFVKIEDGCDNFCTFCIVPFTRGGPRSVPVENVLRQINEAIDLGFKEVVLTGVHVDKYGLDILEGTSIRTLKQLMTRILNETTIARLRITSFEPSAFDPELIELWKDQRLARHVHLPLQSGADTVLRRMARCYDKARFATVAAMFRDNIPDVSITTDLIVGFPGETAEEWVETCRFVEEMNFSKVHVFPFSARRNTPSGKMPDQISDDIKKARGEQMRHLTAENGRRFRESLVGRTFNVLWEKPQRHEDGRTMWSGLTDNYVRVLTWGPSTRNLANTLTPVQLVGIYPDGDDMSGELPGELTGELPGGMLGEIG